MMPKMTLLSPTMLPTERSISPVMMTQVIGRAINKIGVTSSSRKPSVMGVANFGSATEATMITATSRAMIAISRVSRIRRHSGAP